VGKQGATRQVGYDRLGVMGIVAMLVHASRAFNIVPRLVVTLMIRPHPWRIISGATHSRAPAVRSCEPRQSGATDQA
jgi:hypothetical protein